MLKEHGKPGMLPSNEGIKARRSGMEILLEAIGTIWIRPNPALFFIFVHIFQVCSMTVQAATI